MTTPASKKPSRTFKVVFPEGVLADDQSTVLRNAINRAVLDALHDLHLDTRLTTEPLNDLSPEGLPIEPDPDDPFNHTQGLVARELIPE